MRPYLVPLSLFGLAGYLLLDPVPHVSPVMMPAETPAWAVDITPVRQPLLRPDVTVAVYRYRCSECHALMRSPPETDRPLTQHRHIKLNHGINDRCFNCHHRENRNAFAGYGGDPIPYDEPHLLCAKCHGPVYRDWTHGVHGRTNGYWNARLGPVERKKCIECHDPHAPAFQPMAPAPGPNTLRMGDQRPGPEAREDTRSPLLIYRQGKLGRESSRKPVPSTAKEQQDVR